MGNKNLIIFIVIGFIVTVTIWGFIGGCGTSNISWKLRQEPVVEEESAAEGLILEKASLPVEGETYIVQPGDTLWGISKEFGVSVASIKEANKLEIDTISAGQRLIIPGVIIPEEPKAAQVVQEIKETQKPGLVVYKVKKEDSLWRIAQIHGTTIERIAELNGLSKNARLTPGQEILVPGDE